MILPVFILVVFFGVVGHTFLNASISAGNLDTLGAAGHGAQTFHYSQAAEASAQSGVWDGSQPAGSHISQRVSAGSPGMCAIDQFTYLMAFHAFARPQISPSAKAAQRAEPPAYGARPALDLSLLNVPPPRIR